MKRSRRISMKSKGKGPSCIFPVVQRRAAGRPTVKRSARFHHEWHTPYHFFGAARKASRETRWILSALPCCRNLSCICSLSPKSDHLRFRNQRQPMRKYSRASFLSTRKELYTAKKPRPLPDSTPYVRPQLLLLVPMHFAERMTLHLIFSGIHIAKRALRGRHHRSDKDFSSHGAQVHEVIKRDVGRRRIYWRRKS